ncbi:hypothetical protein X975_26489, partial [Stegodyphus mimosarum]
MPVLLLHFCSSDPSESLIIINVFASMMYCCGLECYIDTVESYLHPYVS